MEKGAQVLEWSAAQEIVLSVDLVEAAKQQLHFLATVDGVRCLYDGPILDHAIYRYKFCWLPLLAKLVESSIDIESLVVPLDCEWIWHCHRLNPVQYKIDCEEIYGRLLDNLNVVSTLRGTCTEQTEQIWKLLYPAEPFHLELSSPSSVRNVEPNEETIGATDYDLAAAVKRQSSFYHKVSKLITDNKSSFEDAVARYKAFLHLIKGKHEKPIEWFCVPTPDIDLIWHSHQLYPLSYNMDLKAIFGNIVDHNDRDHDTSNGGKLKTWFIWTAKLWEETFGTNYFLTTREAHQGDDNSAICSSAWLNGISICVCIPNCVVKPTP